MVLDLTIAIPVWNEGKNVQKCFDAIGNDFAKTVVVLDSHSTDETCEIAKLWGAKVLDFNWNGHFPKKRNWFLSENKPDTAWVLFLDADEILTTTFKRELKAILPYATQNGFWLRYSINFLGKELKYGYPLMKLALFRVGAGEYEKIDEDRWSHLDMEIHEHPIIEGEIGTIKSKIDHRDFRDIYHYVAKHNEYSTWEAHRFLQMESLKDSTKKLTLKQKIKYRLARSPFAGIIYFFGAYFLMGGFLDGKRGLAFAILKAGYFTQVYCKIQELEAKKNR